jgi:hypothetical protein
MATPSHVKNKPNKKPVHALLLGLPKIKSFHKLLLVLAIVLPITVDTIIEVTQRRKKKKENWPMLRTLRGIAQDKRAKITRIRKGKKDFRYE